MIKAVLFDFFGVLTDSGASLRQLFADAYGITKDELKTDEMQSQALKGQVADEEFIAAMNRQNPGLPPVSPRTFEVKTDNLVMSVPVCELARHLRMNGIKTGILSNVLRTTANSLRTDGVYNGFDPILLSCEVNLMKPDVEFYRLAVAHLGVQPQEIIFIDDMSKNLPAAEEMGMRTILARDPGQIIQDVKNLLRQENGVQL